MYLIPVYNGLLAWLLLAGLAAATRVVVTPTHAPITPDGVLPYMLLILAPAASNRPATSTSSSRRPATTTS